MSNEIVTWQMITCYTSSLWLVACGLWLVAMALPGGWELCRAFHKYKYEPAVDFL